MSQLTQEGWTADKGDFLKCAQCQGCQLEDHESRALQELEATLRFKEYTVKTNQVPHMVSWAFPNHGALEALGRPLNELLSSH